MVIGIKNQTVTKEDKIINFVIVVPLLIKDEQAFTLFLNKHLWIKKYNGILLVKTQIGLTEDVKNRILINDFILVEMPDKSLFDAWNQSFDELDKLLSLENFYLIFLGIDDELNEMFIKTNWQNIKSLKNDFIYGNAITIFNDMRRKIYPNLSPKLFSNGPFQFDIIHPGMLNKWSTIKGYRFNTLYKLAADLAFYIRISLENEISFLYTPMVQSFIGSEGVSQKTESKLIYKTEENIISKNLNVIILSNKFRSAVLIFLARFPKLYKLFRMIYWRVISLTN